MQWKTWVILAATAVAVAGCSRNDELRVENPCDFPVTVIAEGPDDTAMLTIPPNDEEVALEGGWWPPDTIGVRAVEIEFATEVDVRETDTLNNDVSVSIDPAACRSPRANPETVVVVHAFDFTSPSTVDVAGPEARITDFVDTAAGVSGADSRLERPTPNTARLSVWPHRNTNTIPQQALGDLWAEGDLTLFWCPTPWDCQSTSAVAGSPLPVISLPKSERPGVWDGPLFNLIWIPIGVAIWGSTRHGRRKRAEARHREASER